MTEEILSAVNGQVFAVWFLIGAALVFWMQAGFAMVEAGFTRAKNTGNILMKNLMDFCIGCVVFILWLGWYGFNGAAATSVEQLGSIFLTTTVAPSVATVVCMIFTWVRYGKPDVSMCLNASLAGLVAITAPCDVTDVTGSIIIGAVAGVLVVFGVWFLDNVLRIDDPVGAVAVHCLNGIWGTIAVGLFATTSAPGNDTLVGLFYGGGVDLLIKQLVGFAAVAAWTSVSLCRIQYHGYFQHHDHGCKREHQPGRSGLRCSICSSEGSRCKGSGSSCFCNRHLQGIDYCEAVPLRSVEEGHERYRCNRNDGYPGDGLWCPEGCR